MGASLAEAFSLSNSLRVLICQYFYYGAIMPETFNGANMPGTFNGANMPGTYNVASDARLFYRFGDGEA